MAMLLKPSSSSLLVMPVNSWMQQLREAAHKIGCNWPADLDDAAKTKFDTLGLSAFTELVVSLFTSQGSLRLAQSSSTLIQDLSEVIKPHVRADYPATAEQPVAISESLLLRSLEFPELGSTALANKVAAMKRAYEYANIIFEALRNPSGPRNSPQLEEVLRFVHRKLSLTPYTSGSIVMKEENTFLYEGTFGCIQVGIPPETIKTSMKQGRDPPKIYVLPASIMREAINFGDVEFPIFFNYFCKKAFFNPDQKVIIIGDTKTIDRVKIVFRESIFGPAKEHIYMDEEIAPERLAQGYRVNFAKEVGYLAVKARSYLVCLGYPLDITVAHCDKNGQTPPLEEFAHFKCFDDKGSISFPQKAGDKEVKVTVYTNNTVLQVFEDDVLRGTFDISGQKSAPATYKELPDEIPPSVALFEPPVLGVTFIGTSHGFDPKGRTTGFIIWINGEGILVDPPIQTPEFLLQSGIHRRTVKRVILTHVHSDHDSGLIRKILEGERIEVYTTRTVCEAYVRKVNAILGSNNFADYFTFRPVPIGQVMNICGADFEFDYAFHVLPTVRFKLSYMGKKIAYSADTFYSPSVYANLLKQGVFNLQREVSLRMFLFDADLIMHECGVPPIHTDIFELNNLPASVKQNMHIVHCSGIPQSVDRVLDDGTKVTARISGLSIPKTGVEHTLTLQVGAFNEGMSKATRVLQLLSHVYYFRSVPPSSLVALMSLARELRFRAGDFIVHRGDSATHFFILESGKAEVWAEPLNDKEQTQQSTCVNAAGLVMVAMLGRGHYFGEAALTINSPTATRNANVVAKTDCTVITLANTELRSLFRGDSPFSAQLSIEEDMLKLQKFRPFLREMLAKAPIFKDLKSEQMEVIAASLEEERSLSKGTVLFRQGDAGGSMYFIREGAITLYRSVSDAPDVPPTAFKHMSTGDSFGEMAIISNQPRSATAIASAPTIILELRKNSFDRIMHEHQNLRFLVQEQYKERMQETVAVDTNIRSRSPALQRRSPSSSQLHP